MPKACTDYSHEGYPGVGEADMESDESLCKACEGTSWLLGWLLVPSREDRHEVANRLANSPAHFYDPAAELLALRGFCPACGDEVIGFRDQLSFAEYRVSGMCQDCQDHVFNVVADQEKAERLFEAQEARES